MTDAAPPTRRHDTDSADLAAHGYRQRLQRNLGGFSSFAAAFSYISILTGMFELFGFGYGFAGPLIFWDWLIVLAGQFLVALVFAELSARYPIAGSVYQWSKQVSGRAVAWFAGWTMLVGSVITVSAVAIAEQITLPAIWSGFEVFSNTTQNAAFLGIITIVITTIINVLGVKVMSRINNVGVAAELTGAVVIIILLAVHAHRGPQVVVHTEGAGPGLPGWGSVGYLAPLMLGAIMPAYVMYGFDTAGSLAEETRDPRHTTPVAILRALGVAGAAGALLLVFALMSVRTLGISALGAGGLPLVLKSVLGSTLGKVLLADVAVAIFVCTLAIQTATVRIAFSMARDHRLPFGGRLAHVTETRHSPAVPSVVSGVIAIAIILVNVGNTKIFLVVTSVAIVIVYLAYLLVTAPVMRQRLAGWPPNDGPRRLFSLGRRRGIVLNALAVGYGLAMSVNLIWPRSAIYGTGIFAWGGVITVAAVLGVGAVYYLAAQRNRDNQVALEHRPEDPTGPPAAVEPAGAGD